MLELLQVWLPAWLLGPDAGLLGLFASSFLAATVLPLSSEVVLLGFLALHPQLLLTALLLATVGNTLGGLTTYWAGRSLPATSTRLAARHLERVRRWGAPTLLLSWLPLIGDAFCLAAGWLRLHWLACAGCMAVGKLARYALVAGGLAL